MNLKDIELTPAQEAVLKAFEESVEAFFEILDDNGVTEHHDKEQAAAMTFAIIAEYLSGEESCTDTLKRITKEAMRTTRKTDRDQKWIEKYEKKTGLYEFLRK